MAQFQILYWHDIPTQVRVREGRERVSRPLPDRFMEAVDAAAMAAKLTGTDDYMQGFRWSDAQERSGTLPEIADAVVAELDAQYPVVDWRPLAQRLREG